MFERNVENVTKNLIENRKTENWFYRRHKLFFKMNKCVSLENANVTITMQKKGKQKEATCQVLG